MPISRRPVESKRRATRLSMERSGRHHPKAVTVVTRESAGFGGNRLSISSKGEVLYKAVMYGMHSRGYSIQHLAVSPVAYRVILKPGTKVGFVSSSPAERMLV